MFNNDPNDPHRYDDMLDMPRPVSPVRPRMSAAARAAQFSPFAALTGFEDAIDEAARVTMRQVELGEAEQAELNRKMRVVQDRLDERPVLSITYFVPDPRKAGGRYDTVTGPVRRLSAEEYTLELEGGKTLEIDDIIDIQGAILDDIPF